MVGRPAMGVAQQIIIPGAVQGGGSTNKRWWVFGGLMVAWLFFTAVGAAMEPNIDELDQCADEEFFTGEVSEECRDLREQRDSSDIVVGIGSLFCCGGIIMLIVASLVSKPATKTVVVQQGFVPQAQVVQGRTQVIQTGAVVKTGFSGTMPTQKARAPVPTQQSYQQTQQQSSQQPKPQQGGAPSMDEINKLAAEANNLELARDFAKAAELYQKAGLFAEAGRIRQTYLENDKPVVQIGQIGDSVVKDSVIMGKQNQPQICRNCNVELQPEWKFCPSCNIPL
tara:strand:+ start:379 stop:1224 length:846 start_codon:yes stop_codon:yes gene_type:complete